tara:strand:- start:234 stop:350 length:117 start_codon:yes stop_codon:yes gene_type:complete
MENYNMIPLLLALIFAISVLATGVIIVVLDAIFNLGLA